MSKTTIHIDVVNLVATNRQRNTAIVCANKSYEIKFNFDNAWDEYQDKTARFIWNGEYHDVDFTGDTCEVPEIRGASYVNVGVYVAGAIRTTTSAEILCHPSILCLKTKPSGDKEKDWCDEAQKAAQEAVEAKQAVEAMLGDVGDVEAALDCIIELQNSYIDPKLEGVSTALDEIIEIQNDLIGGGES